MLDGKGKETEIVRRSEGLNRGSGEGERHGEMRTV